MKILIIAHERLIANGTAGSTVTCGFIEAALARGWDVTYLGLVKDNADHSWERLHEFGANGGSITALDLPIRQEITVDTRIPLMRRPLRFLAYFLGRFDFSFVRSFPYGLPAAVNDTYDGVIAFESLSVHVARSVHSRRVVAILGDPVGRRLWHSAARFDILGKALALLVGAAEISYFRYRLPRHFQLAMFGSGHAAQWAQRSRRTVLDLRPVIPGTTTGNAAPPATEKVIITFGGTLTGTASRQSIYPLFDHVLPAFRAKVGSARYEFRLVGDCPEDIRQRTAAAPDVHLMGRVPNFELELEKSHVFLLPMNYPVGVRTRICSALAAGNVCIVHPSVLYNMPELADCKAVRVAEHAENYADIINELIRAGDFQDLRTVARQFFDSHYSAVSAARLLLDCLQAA